MKYLKFNVGLTGCSVFTLKREKKKRISFKFQSSGRRKIHMKYLKFCVGLTGCSVFTLKREKKKVEIAIAAMNLQYYSSCLVTLMHIDAPRNKF